MEPPVRADTRRRREEDEGDGERTDAKRKRVPCNLNDLAPFDIFVRLPPLLVAGVYVALVDHLEGLVNGDFDTSRQFAVLPAMLPLPQDLQAASLDAAQLEAQIAAVVAATNDKNRLQRNWLHISIVDRILSLAEARTWSRSNVAWAEMRKSVFWVSAAKHWCSTESRERSTLKINFGLIILELFYRFIWAGYTLGIFNRLKSSVSEPPTPIQTSTNRASAEEEMHEIVNSADLGADASSEAEDADDDDSQSDDSDADDDESESVSAAQHSEAEMVDEQEDEPTTVPPVTALFSAQEGTAANLVEQSYFEAATSAPVTTPNASSDAAPAWDISIAITAYLQLALNKNRAADPLNPRPVTLLELSDKMARYYKKHLVPLLQLLGVRLSGPHQHVWRWQPHMQAYVERVYTMQFRNLTEDGEVSASSALLELFPDFLLRSESRANLYLARATTELHDSLLQRGAFDPNVDQAAARLSQLLSQRAALILEGATGAHVEALERAVEEARAHYAALTAAVDARPSAPPKPRAARSLKPRPDLHASTFPALIPLPYACRLLSLLPAMPLCTLAVPSALDTSLALACHAVGIPLLLCTVSTAAKPVAKARSKALLASITEALIAEIRPALPNKDALAALIARYSTRMPTSDAAEWLVQAEKSAVLPARQRDAAVTRLAKSLVSATEGSGLPVISVRNVQQAIEKCAAFMRDSSAPLLICLSSVDLFAWRFSRKHTHYAGLCTAASAFPARLRLMIVGTLPPEEWGGNVHAHLPDWVLVARTRMLRSPATDRCASLAAPAPPRMIACARILEQYSAAVTAVTEPMNSVDAASGEQNVDDAYVFVPKARVPPFAQHFALHSLHLSVPSSPASAAFFHANQEVTKGYTGVSLVGLFESASKSSSTEQVVAWQTYIQSLVAAAPSAAVLTSRIVDAASRELAPLFSVWSGAFVISDHPGKAAIVSTATGHELVRFYTDNVDHAMLGALAEAPPKSAGDDGAWHTWRMPLSQPEKTSLPHVHVRRIEGKEGEEEHLFKYALLGSKHFWRISVDTPLLRRLRVRVEARLFDTPEDLVACACTGPMPLASLLPALRRDAANGEPQTRLVSSVEEWLLGSKESVRDEMTASTEGKAAAGGGGGGGGGDLVVAALMNVSLVDPANWSHWRRELNLDSAHAPGWARLTDRAALPAAVLQQLSSQMTI